jgi:DNA-binding response OmpR family regulator
VAGARHLTEHVVLCIDDEQTLLEMLCHYLRNLGYRVFSTGDPESALRIFLNDHIDAVVTDYELGTTTSESLIVSLRLLKPKLPVFIFSGTEELSPSLRSLTNGCFHKIEIRELAAEMGRVLEDRPIGLNGDGARAHACNESATVGSSILDEAKARLRQMETRLFSLSAGGTGTESEINAIEAAIGELRQIIEQNDD